jgi:hypothetical protein
VNLTDISRFQRDKEDCGEYVLPTIIQFRDPDSFIWVKEAPDEVASLIADELRVMNTNPLIR